MSSRAPPAGSRAALPRPLRGATLDAGGPMRQRPGLGAGWSDPLLWRLQEELCPCRGSSGAQPSRPGHTGLPALACVGGSGCGPSYPLL